MEIMRGTFTGIGVGPGDPELLTLKAVRLIRECHVAAVPVSDPGLAGPDIKSGKIDPGVPCGGSAGIGSGTGRSGL